jgi:AraC-like DNA-binding protein
VLVTAAPGALLWPAALVVWGPGYQSSEHRHHSVQLVLALRGGIRIRGGAGGRWLACDGALVRPDARHEVQALGQTVLIAFVEPESELGAALLTRLPRPITPLPPAVAEQWRARLGDPAALDAGRVEAWVKADLLPDRHLPPIHPRVRRVLRRLREEMGTADSLSLERMAAVAGLSPSRLMHAFTESVGVALRPYVLWLRLQRAIGELMRGANATQAAHAAGFSDAAHLSRTVRRMLGSTPSELARRRPSARGAQVSPA